VLVSETQQQFLLPISNSGNACGVAALTAPPQKFYNVKEPAPTKRVSAAET